MQIEDSKSEKKTILYAPLNGIQGVYGVLEMITPDTLIFQKVKLSLFHYLPKQPGLQSKMLSYMNSHSD